MTEIHDHAPERARLSREAELQPVTGARWQIAQRYEQRTWSRRLSFPRYHLLWLLHAFGMRRFPPNDDWNEWWSAAFGDYSMLPDSVDTALEVGCGPFTNLRRISATCVPSKMILNDPLIDSYLGLRRSWVSRVAGANGVVLDSRPLEDLRFPDRSIQLVVMVNVLDHVRDAAACMDRAIRLVGRDGYIVIGQDLYDPLPGHGGYDPGHPIRVRSEDIDRRLGNEFEVLYRRILSRDEGRNPAVHGGTFLFVGRR